MVPAAMSTLRPLQGPRRPWRVIVIGMAIALPFSCRTKPEQPARSPTVVQIPPSTTAAPASAAPIASVACAAGSSSGAATSPLPGAAFAMPDPGPGSFSCGAAVCRAGVEVCAPREACAADWPAQACVPKAELKARTFDESNPTASCKDSCFSWYDYKTCDGAGDCKAGEVCCYDADRIIGPCSGDDGMLDVWECKPAGAGKTPCGTAEVCSDKDPTCRRPGSKCVLDRSSGRGTCQAPRRAEPKCGAAPCPAGQVCIESMDDGKRRCMPSGSHPESTYLIGCDRGSECAPDEACFSYGGGRRCDLTAMSWAGDDVPICVDASDCEGYCEGRTDAVCRVDGNVGICECRPPCQRDGDCKKDEYCAALSQNRYGGAVMQLQGFCDKAQKRCDCRERSP